MKVKWLFLNEFTNDRSRITSVCESDDIDKNNYDQSQNELET